MKRLLTVAALAALCAFVWAVPAGFEDVNVNDGKWDYYALVWGTTEPGTRVAFIGSVQDVQPNAEEGVWAVFIGTTHWVPERLMYTKSTVVVEFAERPRGVRDGDRVIVYALYRMVVIFNGYPIPLMDGVEMAHRRVPGTGTSNAAETGM